MFRHPTYSPKGLTMTTKSAPKSPTKAPLFTEADLPKNRSKATPAKGKAPPPKPAKASASKGKGSR